MHIAPPAPGSDFGFYNTYVFKTGSTELVTALNANLNELKNLVKSLTEDQLLCRYEPGKWSIKEMLQHLVDAERNFCYRAMRISRKDQAPLPMFDIHQFVMNSHADERSTANMMEEWELLRKTTILMFENMHPDMLDLTGPARDVTVSVRALGFAIAGHTIHHMTIIKEKYLPASVLAAQ